MYLKAVLFLGAGTAAVAGLLLERPDLQTAFLLFVAIWSFCRLYYFMFYVIEKYIDPGYRFAGILNFLGYLLRRQPGQGPPTGGAAAGEAGGEEIAASGSLPVEHLPGAEEPGTLPHH
jgi:hypothetical protein